ncbi:hypothetical protein BDA99DRAFT_571962 [Phascolomyces articulosus]|uniref:Uncharacterized protein n=1 Tax=Phascolomyces articulosus TaxID=60185 RepID=A0AAD5K9U9_9FUNG|nr:hypothetical protein BDA99DRAFT_571962 [Phascolomyces articulosus]
MSNLTNGKLAFNVRKSNNVSGTLPNTKSALYPSAITQQDPIKIAPTTITNSSPVKKTNNTTTLSSLARRKRKSPESTTTAAKGTSSTKNHSITRYFTPSPTRAIDNNDSNNNVYNTSSSSSSSCSSLPFSSKNTNTSISLFSDNHTDEENIICHIRNMHSVKEIWSAIVGEYGEETTLEERIRRVRPRKENMLLHGDDKEDQDQEIVLLMDEEDMSRPVRCRMTVQESMAFFNEITNEFFCV